MKKILLVYTGGTIGMVPAANGYSPRPGVFRDALDAIHELHCAGMPGWDFLEMERNVCGELSQPERISGPLSQW